MIENVDRCSELTAFFIAEMLATGFSMLANFLTVEDHSVIIKLPTLSLATGRLTFAFLYDLDFTGLARTLVATIWAKVTAN
jgi:hypothetical protein